MTKSDVMYEINGTIDMIQECSRSHADDIGEANYIANCVESWLDQLRSEIEKYEYAEEDEEDEDSSDE